jgi:hypothetical protein
MTFSGLDCLPRDENNRPAPDPMFNIAHWQKRFGDTGSTCQEY